MVLPSSTKRFQHPGLSRAHRCLGLRAVRFRLAGPPLMSSGLTARHAAPKDLKVSRVVTTNGRRHQLWQVKALNRYLTSASFHEDSKLFF